MTVQEPLWYIFLQFVGCQLCGSVLGLMVTSSKRTCATCCASHVCCSQSPWHTAGHCWPLPLLLETFKHSKTGLAQFLWSLSPGMQKVLSEPSEHLWKILVWYYMKFPLSYHIVGDLPLLLAMGNLYLVGFNILLSMVFSSELQFWSSCRRRWVHWVYILLLCHFNSLTSWR